MLSSLLNRNYSARSYWLQPNIGFSLRRVSAVFTRSAMSSLLINYVLFIFRTIKSLISTVDCVVKGFMLRKLQSGSFTCTAKELSTGNN